MSRKNEAGTLALPWSPSVHPADRAKVDGTVLAVTVLLALIGLVMVFSASAVVADRRFHDPAYFLKRQVVWLTLGAVLLHLTSRLDYRIWRKLVLPMLVLTALLLIAVLLPSVGMVAKGARRWIRIGYLSIQPGELAKLATVLYMAAYLARKEGRLAEFKLGFFPPLIVVGLLSALVLPQPDLGTGVVIGFVTAALLYLSGARMLHLAALVSALMAAMTALVWQSPYRMQRLMTYWDPSKDPTGTGFQMNQSLLAFGGGGLFGVGLGEGKQKLFFLPEAHTDFVLALVGEELGLIGTGVILVLFAILVVKGFQIAARAREAFGRHLALGITLLIGVQGLINAGMVTGLLPTKGLTLPLVSYGGSSLLMSSLGIGILLSISRDRQAGRETWYGRRIRAQCGL